MTPYWKHNIVLYIVFPAGALLIGLAAFNVSVWFLFLILVLPVLVAKLAEKIVCPRCGTPVGWRSYDDPPTQAGWYSPFIGRQCDRCAGPIDRRAGRDANERA